MNQRLKTIAIVVHVRHAQLKVGGLLVYGVAATVCMTHRNKEAKGGGA
jgi:hypothetical protein